MRIDYVMNPVFLIPISVPLETLKHLCFGVFLF